MMIIAYLWYGNKNSINKKKKRKKAISLHFVTTVYAINEGSDNLQPERPRSTSNNTIISLYCKSIVVKYVSTSMLKQITKKWPKKGKKMTKNDNNNNKKGVGERGGGAHKKKSAKHEVSPEPLRLT